MMAIVRVLLGAVPLLAWLLLLVLVVAGWERHQVLGLDAELQAAVKDRVALQRELEREKAAVTDWQTNAEAAQEAGAEALARARVATRAQRPAVDALQARILAATATDCAPAIAEIREALK